MSKEVNSLRKKNNIVINVADGTNQEAIGLEYRIFLDAGYIEPNKEGRVLEYDKYERSKFLIASVKGETAGIVRLVYDDNYNFQTLNDFELYPDQQDVYNIDSKRIVEIGTMVTDKRFRSTTVAWELIRRIMTDSWKNGKWYALSSIDKPFFRSLVRHGMPFTQIGEEKDYMGSITVPTFFDSHKLALKYKPLLYLNKAADVVRWRKN